METAKDPLTGETFYKQRNNQVFANRKNQIKYNNLKALEKRKSIAIINRILDKNRSILISILEGKPEAIKSYDYLLGTGFHFGCSTHTIKRENDNWICIYDYGYMLEGDKTFRIIKL
ncbi:hypothetical protein [Flavivirga eckloniae]|uniref:Uncharacterized protein n=1 Tax=Flavivirga eckloniae TaxID=1803846 RepID=A0A2K9PVZ7_9FLAO|nr:hypothetical protein [Flavivirga eckloniae]AUP81223.1 hypothetical protein C1H87_21900 [Flavivirga eckloniae]